MILLAGCLPPDRSTLVALCDGLAASPEVAARLQEATVEPFDGTWTDAEREALGCAADLPAGDNLARRMQLPEFHAVAATGSVAVASPMHATLGLTDLTPLDPAECALSEDDSRELCDAADTHLLTEGVRFQFVETTQWLVLSDRGVDVRTERPEWMIGESLRPSLPHGADARTVERWMNELQMLLYTHRVNIRREDHGLPPINVVWLWGFSAPGAGNSTGTTNVPDTRWLAAIRRGDVPAWQRAWIDIAPALLVADTIILGDHRPRFRLTPNAPTLLTRVMSKFRGKPRLGDVLFALQAK